MDHFEFQRKRSDQMDRERRKWFIAAKDHRERKQEIEDRAEASALDLIAAAADIERFNANLDAYDEATVKALMRNTELLDAVNARIDAMLLQAHELPDGRKVFKTEDGAAVFDANGMEVSEDFIHPDMIDDSRPSWESYKVELDTRDQLVRERQQILNYQEKLDDAREVANSGDLTKDDLDALEAELDGAMPPAVARELPQKMQAELDFKVEEAGPKSNTLAQSADLVSEGVAVTSKAASLSM